VGEEDMEELGEGDDMEDGYSGNPVGFLIIP
jgi:hypothetical protein